MKIAIPLFKDRVSPYFGSSSKLLLVETHGASLQQEAMWEVKGEGPMEIAKNLVDLGVEELICGGISHFYKDWLIAKGISVVDNQRGVAKEIIQKLLGTKKEHFTS